MTDRSLYETIEELSEVRIERSSYTVRADCGQPFADLLHIPAGAPVLIGEELHRRPERQLPILSGTMSYRADAYRFQADLFRQA